MLTHVVAHVLTGRGATMRGASGHDRYTRPPAWAIPRRDRNHHHATLHRQDSYVGPELRAEYLGARFLF